MNALKFLDYQIIVSTIITVISVKCLNHLKFKRKEVSIMANLKHTVNNANDKVAGKIKESVGKATGDDELELKGKVQSIKADIKGKIQDITDK